MNKKMMEQLEKEGFISCDDNLEISIKGIFYGENNEITAFNKTRNYTEMFFMFPGKKKDIKVSFIDILNYFSMYTSWPTCVNMKIKVLTTKETGDQR